MTSCGPKSTILSQETFKTTTKLHHNRFAYGGSHVLRNVDILEFHILSVNPEDKRDFRIEISALSSCDIFS